MVFLVHSSNKDALRFPGEPKSGRQQQVDTDVVTPDTSMSSSFDDIEHGKKSSFGISTIDANNNLVPLITQSVTSTSCKKPASAFETLLLADDDDDDDQMFLHAKYSLDYTTIRNSWIKIRALPSLPLILGRAIVAKLHPHQSGSSHNNNNVEAFGRDLVPLLDASVALFLGQRSSVGLLEDWVAVCQNHKWVVDDDPVCLAESLAHAITNAATTLCRDHGTAQEQSSSNFHQAWETCFDLVMATTRMDAWREELEQ